MKTAISIRDEVLKKAEKYVKKAKISRSQLYSDALEEYLERRSKEDLIAQINAVCEEVDTSLDPAVKKYQSRIINKEKW